MRGYRRMSLVLPLLPLALASAGCGKGYEFAPVSGRVLMDGQPLAKAQVRFHPLGDKDLPPSAGVTDEEGRYTLCLRGDLGSPGAVVGEHRVTISLSPKQAGMTPDVRMLTGMRRRDLRDLVPPRYNRDSKLTCSVPPAGRKDADFLDLTSE
jgi:hypothetical protein